MAEGLIDLRETAALEAAASGRKAAALASAARAGFPVLDGLVITTHFCERIRSSSPAEARLALRPAWLRASLEGTRAVVVRSSSTGEDGSDSSMAGMFTSILDVGTFDRFVEAVSQVLDSAESVGNDPVPMAVLVQPYLRARVGGIAFGVDPISGRGDRIVVAEADGGPQGLVSGVETGRRFVITRKGRLVSGDGAPKPVGYRRLAKLVVGAEKEFGTPQDIEWAIGDDGRLYLLQSRPVTAVAEKVVPRGPVFGPGPVAETFPGPLARLEEDLWLPPLRDALRYCLRLVASAPRRKIEESPLILSVQGRVAADLGLVVGENARRSFLSRLDPRPPARRVLVSWRVGRIRAALPASGTSLAHELDHELTNTGSVEGMSPPALMVLIERAVEWLVALHGHEILAGMLLGPPNESEGTSAAIGLVRLAAGRSEQMNDDDIIAAHPIVLSLVPPQIGSGPRLPDVTIDLGDSSIGANRPQSLREMLRLRARWVQELTARAAWEIGQRAVRDGHLSSAEQVRDLTFDELKVLALRRPLPQGIVERRVPPGPPLPARFSIAPDGGIVSISTEDSPGHAHGSGGGRGMGRVVTDPTVAEQGDVLVVRTLDPDLAPVLPRLGGLIAETGSVLSHLAILARELSIPTVVGFERALDQFATGSWVVIDGGTGTVELVAEEVA